MLLKMDEIIVVDEIRKVPNADDIIFLRKNRSTTKPIYGQDLQVVHSTLPHIIHGKNMNMTSRVEVIAENSKR